MSFKINNPFGKKDERSGLIPQSFRDERSNFNKKLDDQLRSIENEVGRFEEQMVTRRGTDVYNEEMNKSKMDSQPVFTNSKEKNYPYLMSVFNTQPIRIMSLNDVPYQCNSPEEDARSGTQFCKEFWDNRQKSTLSIHGTERGLMKDMEADAKLSNQMMEEILQLQNNEIDFEQNVFDIIQKYRPNFKLGFNGANVKNNYKNVAWQTNMQLNKIVEDHFKAQEAQDLADKQRINSWKFKKASEQGMKEVDQAIENLKNWRNI